MRFILSRSVFWSTLTFYSVVVILTEKGFGEYKLTSKVLCLKYFLTDIFQVLLS